MNGERGPNPLSQPDIGAMPAGICNVRILFSIIFTQRGPEFVCVWGKTLFVLIWGFAKCTSKQVHSVTYHKYKSLWRGGHVAG